MFGPPSVRGGRLVLGFIRDLGRRRRYGAPVIVVSGLPRSGTSMMMNMLTSAGLQVMSDAIREADEDNPKGYFEDERVKDLDRLDDKTWLVDCRGKVVKVISFLLKDLPEENFYKVIFMRRDLEEVIASQNKMLRRRGETVPGPEDDRKMIDRYQFHLRKTQIFLEEMPNFEHIDAPYREVLDEPREHARRIASFLGMPLDVGRMAEAVDRSLYRNRREAQQSA